MVSFMQKLQKELLSELVEALFKNGRRYNLLNSAILETFKFIKDENIKSLIHYLIENHWSKLKLIKYSNLFEQMKEKHDQNRAQQVRLTVMPKNLTLQQRRGETEPNQMHGK